MSNKIDQYKIILKVRQKVRHHAQAYSTDIFPDYALKDEPSPSIDRVSAKMGRHMCKCFEEYLNEAIEELRGPNDQGE